jgi:hypothetical protein
MKLALIFFSVLMSLSLWFGAQDKPITCSGKPLPIMLLPGPKITGPELPLRFGGTRKFPGPPINLYKSDDPFRLVIRTRDEFNDFWKKLITSFQPNQVIPPPPEVDFSKDMVIIAAMGMKPTSGYFVIIDGACEIDGHVEVFVSNIDSTKCGGGQLQVLTYPADAVRLPQTKLPVVFRETQIPCDQWHNLIQRSNRAGR